MSTPPKFNSTQGSFYPAQTSFTTLLPLRQILRRKDRSGAVPLAFDVFREVCAGDEVFGEVVEGAGVSGAACGWDSEGWNDTRRGSDEQ